MSYCELNLDWNQFLQFKQKMRGSVVLKICGAHESTVLLQSKLSKPPQRSCSMNVVFSLVKDDIDSILK